MIDLVIRLPKEVYEEIMDGIEDAGVAGVPIGDLAIGFRDGTVLPKGHGRLIDERHLREDMERAYKFANELVALGFVESFLEHAPTIIEADEEGAEE